MPSISSPATEEFIDDDQVRREVIGLISTGTTLDSVDRFTPGMRKRIKALLLKTAGVPIGEGIHSNISRKEEVNPRFLSTVATPTPVKLRIGETGTPKKR